MNLDIGSGSRSASGARRLPFAALLVAHLLLVGCVVQPVYYQAGVAKDAMATQAVVELGDKNGNVIVRALDGKELADPYTTWNGGYSAVRELRLSAGRHTLVGMAWNNGPTKSFEITQTFEAGARYKIAPLLQGYSLSVEVRRIDSGESK